jgi:hypothetical protein
MIGLTTGALCGNSLPQRRQSVIADRHSNPRIGIKQHQAKTRVVVALGHDLTQRSQRLLPFLEPHCARFVDHQ